MAPDEATGHQVGYSGRVQPGAMLLLPVALAFNAIAWFVGVRRPAFTGEPAAA